MRRRRGLDEVAPRAEGPIMRSLLLGYALALGAAPVSGPVSGQVPEWTLERGVTIGSVDDPVYGLSGVGGVLADAERVFVLLRQDATVRVFSRAGEFIRDLGRRGAGPGEFTQPNRMGWHGSRLWVNESMSPRFTFFDVATGEAETIHYRANVPGSLHRWMPLAVLADGRVVASPQLVTGPGGALGVSELPIIVTELDGTLRDTLARQSIDGLVGTITEGLSVGAVVVTSPIPSLDFVSAVPDGSGIVLVRQGWNGGPAPAEFEVMRIDLHGDTMYRRRIEYEPRPVPSDYFDDRIANDRDDPDISNRRAYARALREFYEQRRYFPPVTAVTVGNDGTTWLAREREDGDREWLVLDGAGSAIGRFRLPRGGGIRFANLTECWVVERDALDIPYVVQYNIVR